MADDDRVIDAGEGLQRLVDDIGRHPLTHLDGESFAGIVSSGETIQQGAQSRRERVVGRADVALHGVTAGRRCGDGSENGDVGDVARPRMIGVPSLPVAWEVLCVVEDDADRRRPSELGDNRIGNRLAPLEATISRRK
jgi:hypothetical protein